MRPAHWFAGALLYATIVQPAPARETTLLINSFMPPAHPINTRVLKPWSLDVYKATEGRVRVFVAPSSLAPPQAQRDAVTRGIVDGAYMFHGLMSKQVQLPQLAHLPLINTTARGSSIALWRTHEKFFAPVDEYKDIHVISLFTFAPGLIYGIRKPISTIDDLKGTRLYALPGVPARLLAATGAGVVAEPAARSHELISSGTVDAFAGYPVTDALSFKTASYARDVMSLPGHLTVSSFVFFISKKKWNELSEPDRAAITRLGGEAFAARSAVYDEIEAQGIASLRDKGISIRQADAAFVEALQQPAGQLHEAWRQQAEALGVDGKAALDYYRAQAIENQ